MNSPSLCVKDVRNILHELKKFQKDKVQELAKQLDPSRYARVFPVRDKLPGVETWLIIRKKITSP